jgi:uncharacterized protein YjbI with pentapeptide repeats
VLTFEGADLRGADLEGADVKTAKNWDRAYYSPAVLSFLGLEPNHNQITKTKYKSVVIPTLTVE